MPCIAKLVSGGIITNYDCSAKCRHCVYASSPLWPKDYLSKEDADDIFALLRQNGCFSVHIGGGEPLLRPEHLFRVLDSARENGISIEYIETNSSWYRNAGQAGELLARLMDKGVDTLLLSIDPFHNESIPFDKVKAVMEACRNSGMGIFPWRMEFWDDLDALDGSKTHRLSEYREKFGEAYEQNLITRYGLNLRGRALQTYKPALKHLPYEQILKDSAPCRELTGVHHFHIDLYGNYIPQSCAGLSLHYRDLSGELSEEKYPVFCALLSAGIGGLYHFAVNKYGFVPKREYAGKCDLCYDIRAYLVMSLKQSFPDLQPVGHYMYM